ncbi:MAG: isoprenylcysteine carboxylmethyltransferase family protein [Gammaproteobacteria bacterium]|nr:isoprenylcysteine carboxylmethyltransferase family protein [Gammaproteobacteria bacterium]
MTPGVKEYDNSDLAHGRDIALKSHRTQDLEPLSGFAHFIRELRYNEVARQSLAVVLILIYALTSEAVPWSAAVGLALAIVGMLVRLYASGYIMKNKELAQSGPYALVRHPLYTGNILLVIGFSIANLNVWAIPVALVFFWFYYPTAIEYEDRKLHGIFGQDWEQWAARTPALIPNFGNVEQIKTGSWSFAKSMRKNGELFIVAFVLICAYLVVEPLL